MFVLRHPGFQNVSFKYGIAAHVREKARARKLPVDGLESVDEHVNVLAGMNDAESEVFLLESLVFGDAEARTFPQLVADWKSGHTKELYALEHQFMPTIADAPRLN